MKKTYLDKIQEIRNFAAEMFTQGKANCDIALELGVSRQTVSRWRTVWSEQGLEGLKVKPHGKPSRMSDEQWRQVEMALLGQNSRSDRKEDRYQVSQRPCLESAYEIWLVLPKAGARLVFVDESGFSELPNVRRTWSPRGVTPIIRHHFNWKRLHAIVAIDCEIDGSDLNVVFYLQPGTINKESMVAFLDAMHSEIDGPVVLLWDGLPVHRSKIVKEHIDSCKEWLKVERFPAYAPELNPVEYLLSAIKSKDVANLCAVSIDHIASKLEDAALPQSLWAL